MPLKLQPGETIQRVDPGPRYNEIFPVYAEICAVSQMKGVDEKPGGPEGHAVLWLQGACKDETKPYPALKPCSGQGTGISVNKIFENVNWVATPDKTLFFEGGLKKGETLTEERRQAALERALETGVYKGVTIHPQYLGEKPADMEQETFITRKGLGTDYALSFGRSVMCSRVPLTEDQMAKAIDFLNGLNEKYFAPGREYDWSGYYNNCAHTVHNALAAAGVWEAKSVNERRVKQLLNHSVPANEFANLAILTMEESPVPGAMFSLLPVHAPNELYDPQFTLYVLEGQIFMKQKSRKIREMVREKRFTDLDANLEYFREKYVAVERSKTED